MSNNCLKNSIRTLEFANTALNILTNTLVTEQTIVKTALIRCRYSSRIYFIENNRIKLREFCVTMEYFLY